MNTSNLTVTKGYYFTACGHTAVVEPSRYRPGGWLCRIRGPRVRGHTSIVHSNPGAHAAKNEISRFLRVYRAEIKKAPRKATGEVRPMTDPFVNNRAVEAYVVAMYRTFEVAIGNDLASKIVDDIRDNIFLDAVKRMHYNLMNLNTPGASLEAVVEDLKRYWVHPLVCQRGLEAIVLIGNHYKNRSPYMVIAHSDLKMQCSIAELLISVLETHVTSVDVMVPLWNILKWVHLWLPSENSNIYIRDNRDRFANAIAKTLVHYSSNETILSHIICALIDFHSLFDEAFIRIGMISYLWTILENDRVNVTLIASALVRLYKLYMYQKINEFFGRSDGLADLGSAEKYELFQPPQDWEEILNVDSVAVANEVESLMIMTEFDLFTYTVTGQLRRLIQERIAPS